MNRLQTVIEKQRAQIKKLEQSVSDYKAETDEVRNEFAAAISPFLFFSLFVW